MKSLKAKLIFFTICLVVGAQLITGGIIVHKVEDAMHHENHKRGLVVAHELAQVSIRAMVSYDLAELRNFIRLTMDQEYVVQAMILDPHGHIIMHNDLSLVGSHYGKEAEFVGQEGKESFSEHYYTMDSGDRVVDIKVPIVLAGKRLGDAVISYSHAGVTQEVRSLKINIGLIFLAGTGVAILFSFLLGEYLIRPLRHLSYAAAHLGKGRFDITKMNEQYNDELGDLTNSFYEMAGKLEKKVCLDTLTGVHNRQVFEVELAKEWAKSQRHHSTLVVMMIDVDHFKRVNDTYGHMVGDEVLKGVARVLAAQVRVEDCLARYGGEEFVIMLPDTDKEEAVQAAERVRAAVEAKSFLVKGLEISITISLGVAFFPNDTEGLEELVEQADKALYVAKEQGRNRVVLAEDVG